MNIATRLCQFVDRDLTKNGYVRSGAKSLLIALLPIALAGLFLSRPFNWSDYAIIALAVSTSAGWQFFVGWRGLRILRAVAIQADRKYDRKRQVRVAA